ncbi:MAG TPA: tetratricopeptide repeat protein [Kofleriaceae bacterium]
MQRLPVVASAFAALVSVLGCSSPPPAHPNPELLASADAELRKGCHDCLIEARASYRRLAVGADRPQLIARVFESDLLIALRDKELGLPPSDALAEARRIAPQLPRELEAERGLELVDAIPSHELGLPRRELRAFLAAHAAQLGSLDQLRAHLAGSRLRAPVRDYLRLALDCAYPRTDRGAPLPPVSAPAGAAAQPSPLLGYRAAICGFGPIAALAAVRAREPRFVETSLFIASTELALAADGGPQRAKAHLAEALARFPASPAIAYLMGAYDLLVGDYREALPFYDRVLAAQPAHDQALLGRIVCLSNLERPQEAIEAATRLVDLGADSLSDAYYWRARNRHALGQLGDARRDIAAARDLIPTADVLTLAGIIEYDQGDLDPAQADLATAIDRNGRDCTARWYLALVHHRRRDWRVSAHAFEDAIACYRERARDSAERVRALEARADLDPAYQASLAASLAASIAADTRQLHLAALAGASCAAAGGDIASAASLLELAGEDPALADRVTRLRASFARPRRPRD